MFFTGMIAGAGIVLLIAGLFAPNRDPYTFTTEDNNN